MIEPPLLAGALKPTLAMPLPGVAVPMVGAPGLPMGTTLFDAVEGLLVPELLAAVTVKV